MPSLPELEVYKQQFTDALVGQAITGAESTDVRVVHASSEALDSLVVGHKLIKITRYGKWLLWDTGAPEQLIIHLGLTGKLRLIEPEEPSPHFASFTVSFEGDLRLVLSDQRHLGKVYVRDFAQLKDEKALGPDLFSIEEDYFTGELGDKKRAVRDILMDQKLIAGIGGKYADEILWQAKINPHTKMDDLYEEQQKQLYQLTRSINDRAIALDADIERFPADWLIPHRHTDRVCPRGHGKLMEEGSMFYCLKCQVLA